MKICLSFLWKQAKRLIFSVVYLVLAYAFSLPASAGETSEHEQADAAVPLEKAEESVIGAELPTMPRDELRNRVPPPDVFPDTPYVYPLLRMRPMPSWHLSHTRRTEVPLS